MTESPSVHSIVGKIPFIFKVLLIPKRNDLFIFEDGLLFLQNLDFSCKTFMNDLPPSKWRSFTILPLFLLIRHCHFLQFLPLIHSTLVSILPRHIFVSYLVLIAEIIHLYFPYNRLKYYK